MKQALDDMAVAVDQLLETRIRLVERLDGFGVLGKAGLDVMDHAGLSLGGLPYFFRILFLLSARAGDMTRLSSACQLAVTESALASAAGQHKSA